MNSPETSGSQEPAIDVRPEETPGAGPVLTAPRSGLSLDALERALIGFALEIHGGNRTRAARFLRLSRSALIYRMHKHGITIPARPR